MESHQPCLLCALAIDSQNRRAVDTQAHADIPWWATYQMLRLRTDNTGRESLVRPFVNFCIDLKSPYVVHVVCWSVLKKVAQPNDTDPQWLRRFTLVQHNLWPFLKVIPFRNSSPGFFDSGLEEELERCTERIQAWKNGRNIDVFARLPNEIIQVIHDFLDSHHDMLNLWQVTSVEPSPKKWLPPGRKYLAYGSPFIENNTSDKAVRMIQRLLWNLHVEPSRFPHCVFQNQSTVDLESAAAAAATVPAFTKPSLKQPNVWNTAAIGFDRHKGMTLVFLSSTNLKPGFQITVYSAGDGGHLCGMRFIHLDGEIDILGETGKEYWSTAGIDDDQITQVTAYYTVKLKTRYRIRGLRFECASSRHFEVGDSDGACTSQTVDVSSNGVLTQNGFIVPTVEHSGCACADPLQ
ncbi:hypothetical protein EMCG_02452 [[Emmonsia] crescens]|uniref:Uncharacterized protein n=1 Tax=[Emmonsia] crescens TaxID=73230 RepID=A0A0G2HY59_9EURO|nr:hypothetical protein EMCG_02452 [Emmonsia crescens UAMH 3008]